MLFCENSIHDMVKAMFSGVVEIFVEYTFGENHEFAVWVQGQYCKCKSWSQPWMNEYQNHHASQGGGCYLTKDQIASIKNRLKDQRIAELEASLDQVRREAIWWKRNFCEATGQDID